MKNYILIKKKEKEYTFFNKKNKIKKNKKTIDDALEGLYLPPAYDDVKINLNKKAKVLAIGYDNKKRAQYVYNKKFTEKMKKKKFNDLYLFGLQYKKINADINKNLKLDSNEKLKQVSMILKLIMDCDFRVGNDEYLRQNNSYGVSTLKNKHILVNKDKVTIDFIGKKSVRNTCDVNNKTIKKHLKTKKKTIKNNARIFTYKKDESNIKFNVHSTDVNSYIKQFGSFSSKDFRTWSANIKLIKYLLNSNEDDANKDLKECVQKVADKLHHTPEVCKKNYLYPDLIEFYLKDKNKFLKFFKTNIDKQFTLFLKGK